MGKAMVPAHSPSIAHACVQSSGVLALHPSRGVRSSPPLIASVGSSGTAVVARKLARLSRSAVTQSSAVLRLAGWAIRRAFGAGALLGEELGAVTDGRACFRGCLVHVHISCLNGDMSCHNDQAGIEFCLGLRGEEYCWGALVRAGHYVVLHCCGSSCLIRHKITSSAISNNEVGTQSEPMRQNLLWGTLGTVPPKLRHQPRYNGPGVNLYPAWMGK